MSHGVRDALADLIYAVIGAVVCLVLAAVDSDWIASIGRVGLLIAGLFALYALYEIAQSLRSSDGSESTD